MSTTDKLNKLLQTKADIKLALINKGLNPSDVFSSYADNIAAIESGGGGSGGGLDFTLIGYSGTPEYLNDAFTYSKQIYDNWDSNTQSIGYANDLNLVWFPLVDTSKVMDVNFNSSCLEIFPAVTFTSELTSLTNAFRNTKIKTLDVSNWDTSNVNSMTYMFRDSSYLETVDLSSLNTSKVLSFEYMFYSCKNLTSVNMANLDTSKVIQLGSMFSYNDNLTSVNLSNWNTSNVTSMGYMFNYCKKIEEIDISSFSFNKITSSSSMNSMFSNCLALKRLIYPENYPYNLLTSGMFSNDKFLTYLGGSIYIKDNTYTSYLNFPNYAALERLLLKNFGYVSSNLTSVSFTSLKAWGTGSDEARQSLIDSLITYSYDRVANGLEAISIGLSDTTKALLTEDEIAQMTAKGYTLA